MLLQCCCCLVALLRSARLGFDSPRLLTRVLILHVWLVLRLCVALVGRQAISRWVPLYVHPPLSTALARMCLRHSHVPSALTRMCLRHFHVPTAHVPQAFPCVTLVLPCRRRFMVQGMHGVSDVCVCVCV